MYPSSSSRALLLDIDTNVDLKMVGIIVACFFLVFIIILLVGNSGVMSSSARALSPKKLRSRTPGVQPNDAPPSEKMTSLAV